MVDVILGLQWGDEGKGKIVDTLAHKYDMVCRFQGGPNAGHTLIIGDQKYVLHTIPSGIFRPEMLNVVGNGVVLDPIVFVKELEKLDAIKLDYVSRLFLSKKLHLILPTHRLLDAANEAAKGKAKIGSTLRGIGPTYMDKTGRNGLRLGDAQHSSFNGRYNDLREKHLGLLSQLPDVDFDLSAQEKLWFEAIERILTLQIVDCKKILAEGAQGSMLDIDFGTYPFVTSSNTVTAGVCSGLGIAPQKIKEVIGITKAYATRVGSGPFPTELDDQMGERLRKNGFEFGATTGRPRRCGWIDIPQLNYTIMLNGVTQIALTKIDVMDDFESIQVAEQYRINDQLTNRLPYDLMQYDIEPVYKQFEGWQTSLEDIKKIKDLPKAAHQFVNSVEKSLQLPITMVSNGPERSQLID
ncbi:UNVERIFIED_CONTAM: hypothetical protein GTU68_050151 [Idotea baltica]|nr:hypothetical protein [Idotea baltica]